jgi:hypothetical protein
MITLHQYGQDRDQVETLDLDDEMMDPFLLQLSALGLDGLTQATVELMRTASISRFFFLSSSPHHAFVLSLTLSLSPPSPL